MTNAYRWYQEGCAAHSGGQRGRAQRPAEKSDCRAGQAAFATYWRRPLVVDVGETTDDLVGDVIEMLMAGSAPCGGAG